MNDYQVTKLIVAIDALKYPMWLMVGCLYFLTLSSCIHK